MQDPIRTRKHITFGQDSFGRSAPYRRIIVYVFLLCCSRCALELSQSIECFHVSMYSVQDVLWHGHINTTLPFRVQCVEHHVLCSKLRLCNIFNGPMGNIAIYTLLFAASMMLFNVITKTTFSHRQPGELLISESQIIIDIFIENQNTHNISKIYRITRRSICNYCIKAGGVQFKPDLYWQS